MNPLDLILDILTISSRISGCIANVQANKEQSQRLAQRLQVIVDTLRGLRVEDTEAFRKALNDLKGHMEDCEAFIKEFTSKKGLARIFKSGKYKKEFERLNRGLEEDLLQLNVGINVQQLMNRDEDELDRRKDAEELLGKQDEILKLVGEETEKVDDIRQILTDLFAFLRQTSKSSEAELSDILIEAEEVECGEEITKETKGTKGASVIYRGRFRGQDVAVKTFVQVLDDTLRKQFEREVRVLKLLRSDRMVLFYGACLKPNKECLVMKYMPHGSLSEVLERKERFTPEQQERIALEIAGGLQYLHSQGMIHRNLKDRYILFDEDWHAKLTGFGLSKVKSSAIQTIQQHEVSFWSAPELLRRGGCHTLKSDIYSYGLILWELLTGQKPYAHLGLDSRELFKRIRAGYRESIPEDLPKVYADLIRQCWDADPSKRPSLEVIIHKIETNRHAAEELYELGSSSEGARKYDEARDYYMRSAGKGSVRAKTNLGLFFWQGKAGVVDKPRAFALLSEAAKAGHIRAQFNLGQMLEYGDGVKKDYSQALDWYQKAAAQGDKEAIGRVEHVMEKIALEEAHAAPRP